MIHEITIGFDSHIFDIIHYIEGIIDFDSFPDRILVIEDLQHDFIENIVVAIGMHGSSLNYSICSIKMGLMPSYNHVYVDGRWVVPMEAFERSNPFGYTAFSIGGHVNSTTHEVMVSF